MAKATISGNAAGSAKEDGALTATGTLKVSDKDPGEAHTLAVTNAASAYGTWSVNANGQWTYKLSNGNAAVQALGAGDKMTDSFVVTSQDGSGTKTVTVTITGTNDVASLSGQTSGSVTEGAASPISGTLSVADKDGGQAGTKSDSGTSTYGAWSVDTAGHWSYQLDNASAAVKALTAGQTAIDSFTVKSTDGSAGKLVTVTIHGTDDTTTITGDNSGSVKEDGTLSDTGTLTVTGAVPGTQAASGSASYGAWSVDATGHWTYTLSNGNAAVQALGAGAHLSDSFTVTSADGTATDTVTVTIDGTNDVAKLTSTAAAALKEDGVKVTTGVATVTDADTGEAHTQAASGNASYGSWSVDATGHWSYTLSNGNAAVQGLAAGHTLKDSFTVSSADGSASKVISVTINGTNDVATMTGQAKGSVTENTGIDATGILTVSDKDSGQAHTKAQSASATYGTWSVDTNGHWSYHLDDTKPAVDKLGAGQTLTDSFTVTSQDGTAHKVVTVTINGVDDSAPITLTGDDNVNQLTGTSANETLLGLGADDTLNGLGGNDTLDGGKGNDDLEGGAGDDTAVFHGNLADYQIVYTFGGAYIRDMNLADGDDGRDGLFEVEHAKFADDMIDIRPEPIVNGIAAGDNAGQSVAGIGDINRDGFDDFVIGAPGANGGTGAAYVVFGGAGGLPPSLDLSSLDGTSGFTLKGVAAGDATGFSVSGAGDVNKDGYADFVIGALHADAPGADSGAAYVVFGHGGGYDAILNLSTLNGSNGFKFDAVGVASDFAGGSVAAADINGDGYTDILVGIDGGNVNGNNTGETYVIYGHPGSFATDKPYYYFSTIELDGKQAYDHSGWSVSSAGDFNGDGIEDVVVGAIAAGTSGGYTGAAYVVFGQHSISSIGNLDSLDGKTGIVLAGVSPDELAGFSVSSAGDFNGDGFDDVIVSAPYADVNGSNAGSIYVVFGHGGAFSPDIQLGGLSGADGFKVQGPAVGDYAGWSVSAAGDVNGDGFEDIIIGAPNVGAQDYGAAYVLFGQAAPMSATIDLNKLDARHGFWVYGDYGDDFAGVSVSGAGDINGDGFDDLLVGAPGADRGGDASGAVEVIFGGSSSSHTIGGTENADTLTGTSGDDSLRGLGGDDTLNGLGGNDILDGGEGVDKMVGDGGNDVYVLDNAGDTVTEAVSGGNDTVAANGIDIDLTMGSFAGQEIEDVTLIGTGNNNATGNALDNSILGNDGDNRLSGGAGNDSMAGGKGNDTYTVDASGDKVTENSSAGTDTVQSSLTYTLTNNVENLVLTGTLGTENLGGTGNGLDNRITGNAGNNALDGAGGNDTLSGGKGIDTLTGGAGNDVFAFATGDSSGQAGLRDSITDFKSGADHIDLHLLDTNLNSAGVQIARFIGNQAFQEAGDLHYSYDAVHNVTILEADFDGDKISDFGIEFAGKIALTVNDFVAGSVLDLNRPASVTIVNDDDVSIDYSGIRPTVSAAGDINHDGYADFVIGLESSSNPNGSLSGDAYVVYGTRAGIPDGLSLADIDGTNGFKIWGAAPGESLGFGADSAGDFNGDGIDDLLLSAPGSSAPAGSIPTNAYLIYGNATDSSPVDLSVISAADGAKFHGQPLFIGGIGSVSSLGDINADGYDDIAIGFPSTSSHGVAYVVFGGDAAIPSDLTTLDGSNGFKIPGATAFGALGQSVSSAGDFNGDGIKDLVVSDTDSNGHENPHVIFGHAGAFSPSIQAADLNGANGFTITGIATKQGFYFNQEVSSGGDVNGDGYADLIIGAGGISVPGKDLTGAAFVVFGHGGEFTSTIDVSNLDGTNGFVIYGAHEREYLGNSVSILGDLNGDGYADILVGGANAYNTGGAPDPGHAYVLYGHASGFSASIDLSHLTASMGFAISGHALNDQAGWSVSGAGDLDGDGLDDVIVASPQPENGIDHGEVQIIYGKAAPSAIMGTDNADTLNGTSAANILIGGHGNDTINGNGGADSIHGGSGDDHIHVSSNAFFRIDGGSGMDTLHLDYAGAIDFGNLDGNAATSDRGKISNIETIDVTNGQNNALTLHLADVLDLAVQDTNVGSVASLDNVLKIDGNAGDTLHLATADGWSAANTATLAGYAVYTHDAVKIAVDTDIHVTVG